MFPAVSWLDAHIGFVRLFFTDPIVCSRKITQPKNRSLWNQFVQACENKHPTVLLKKDSITGFFL